jgi:RNA polymerase sigma factor (sigma-70 family)
MNNQDEHIDSQLLDDATLWIAFKAGDQKAYAYIYQKHVRLLFKYGINFTKDRELVKDCIQELFMYLWERKDYLGATNNITFYLFKSLRRSIINKINKADLELSENEIPSNYHVTSTPSYETDLIKAQSNQDHIKQLILALNKLPIRQKEAVFLKYYHHMSFEEIADVMSVNRKSVYKLMQNAICSLRKSFLPVSVVLTAFFSIYVFLLQN